MLILEGKTRPLSIDLYLSGTLAFVAGALNSAGFYAVGLFSANMTGNLSTLADYLALGAWYAAGASALIIFIFILGACVATYLIEMGKRRAVLAVYAYCIILEALIIGGLGLSALIVPEFKKNVALILGLSLAMGMQNATTTRISDAKVRTTHVSGMITDIGIGLTLLFTGRNMGAEGAETKSRLKLYAVTIAAFALGGILGVVTYERYGGILLVVTSLFLLILAARGIRRARYVTV